MKFLILLFIGFGALFSQEMAIDAKCESLIPIRRLQIFSERCSGSNYITALLIQHFHFDNCLEVAGEDIPKDHHGMDEPFEYYSFCDDGNGTTHKLLLYPYGYKHFPPWFCLPPEFFSGPSKLYDFSGSEDCLFVVIFRNPYDWVRSFYRTPWNAIPEISLRTFSEFIRLPWETETTSIDMVRELRCNPWVDHNPLDGAPFETVFDLRKSKIENMLLIKNKVKSVYYVNYESVLADPQKFLAEIQEIYGLKLEKPYHCINYYKGSVSRGLYQQKVYPTLSQEDLRQINQKLDAALEERIGYQL